MIIPVEGLPKGYLLLKSPDMDTYLLGYLQEGAQKVDEIKFYDTKPDLETCLKDITDWDCALEPNKR